MDPLELLPLELWQEIFRKVEDPQDWLNLYRASSTFEGVVGQERTQALFSKVIPQLQKYLGEDENGLLGLRLVSRRWKKAVDATLEASQRAFGDESAQFSELQWKYNFEKSKTISRFLDKFGAHPGNPFVGRFVRFAFHFYVREGLNFEYTKLVQRVMDRFGHNIRKMCILCDVRADPGLNVVLGQFRSSVTLAPNLEALVVQFIGWDGVNFRFDNAILGRQPLPIVSKLKLFYFTGNGLPDANYTTGLQNILARLCCNPDTLTTANMIGVPRELTTYPNLEVASVVVTRVLEDTSNLMNSSWPLSRLSLCPGEVLFPPIPLDASIVECIEHFKETLTALWIGNQCTAPAAGEPNLEFSPDLPRLKYLSMPLQFMSFQFLRNLSSLEKLRMFEHGRLLDEDGIKAFFDSVETQISEYKLWEILPNLRKLEMVKFQPDWPTPKPICKVYNIIESE